MSNFSFTINTNGAAFRPDAGPEVARMLRTLADSIDMLGIGSLRGVQDINGNTVGTVTVELPPDPVTVAEKLGKEHGHNAGTWVFDGNTDADRARAAIRGYDDGDPAVMNMAPSPLSGEFAGDMTVWDLYRECGISDDDDRADDVATAYEEAFSDAWWAEVLRAAKVYAGEDSAGTESDR